MQNRKPMVLLFAGPNGSGKTTHAAWTLALLAACCVLLVTGRRRRDCEK